jgi:hypothetical protein
MCAMLTLFAAGNLFSDDEIVRLQGIELKKTADPPVVDIGRIPVGTEKVFGVPAMGHPSCDQRKTLVFAAHSLFCMVLTYVL